MSTRFSKHSSDLQTKEDFCPACVAIPLAMAGAGAGGYGAYINDDRKKWIICISCGFTAIMIAVAIYYFFVKPCKACR